VEIKKSLNFCNDEQVSKRYTWHRGLRETAQCAYHNISLQQWVLDHIFSSAGWPYHISWSNAVCTNFL